MLKEIKKEIEDLKIKVYSGQSLEDTVQALDGIEQMLMNVEPNINAMSIDKVIQELKEVQRKEILLSSKIREYYKPIIDEMKKNKDLDGLEKLVFSLPECSFKMDIYHTIRKVKK